jgi:hypothetical protein
MAWQRDMSNNSLNKETSESGLLGTPKEAAHEHSFPNRLNSKTKSRAMTWQRDMSNIIIYCKGRMKLPLTPLGTDSGYGMGRK